MKSNLTRINSFRLSGFLLIMLLLAVQTGFAQDGVRIASSAGTADPSAMLDVISSAKGVLIPRMTSAQRIAISSPATGLLVFQTDGTPGFYYNAGTPSTPNWVILSAGAISGVGLTNYAARWTSPSLLGTGVIVDNGTNVGIGVTSPNFKLDIGGNIGLNRNSILFQENGGSVATDGSYGIYWHSSGVSPSASYGIYRTPGAWTSNSYQQLRIQFDTGIQLGPGTGNNAGYDRSFVEIVNGKGLMVSSGNLGIGTTAPAQKLHVVGNVKATQLDVANGAAINIHLAQCGGGCGSYHTPLNAWINVGAYGYAWATNLNTAPDVFSHNGTGTITILQSGTYTIRLHSMTIPTSTVAWIVQNIPFINGSPDGFPPGGQNLIHHGYNPAGWWRQDVSEFTRNLSAGTTVSYGYLGHHPLSYWAHDTYTGMEIRRVN